MKTTALLLALATCLFAQERIVLVPEKPVTPPPLFYSAAAAVTARATLERVTSDQDITFTIIQGKPETLSLSLTGQGDVVSVTGENLLDWSVRSAKDGSRFLDIRPILPADAGATLKTFTVRANTVSEPKNGPSSLLLPGPGPATGFSLNVSLDPAPGTDLRITDATGLAPLESGTTRKFISTTTATLGFSVSPAGTASKGLELLGSSLTGKLSADSESITFILTATARAEASGSSADLLSGDAALTTPPSAATHHIALTESNGYELIADSPGEFPVSIEFVVPLVRKGDWFALDFRLPAGVVVPVTLEGLPEGVSFNRDLAIVPQQNAAAYRGFLPANGQASLAFKKSNSTADGTLFFSSTATTDIRIGSGLMRQFTALDLRVLQGKLPSLSLTLDGPGEILAVNGESVLAWTVSENAGKRSLDLKLSRPIENSERIIIEARAALGAFPVKMEPLRISPVGTLRHSGFVRVANDGAVRIEVADAKGLIQLAPDQFPGGKDDTLRQVFVFRFPSAAHSFQLQADQILPEIGVTEVTVYELAETDRRIIAGLELDIREAPVREWEFDVPADHAVASVTGAEVADYALASEAKDGLRRLKIIFKKPVMNRQLVEIRLEKNEAAKAEAWALQPLAFPGAKSHRGYIGAVSTPGYRLVAGKTEGVAEVPVTFFPRKTANLQQAFRLRETKWQIPLTVEALGQSIQADVFHLYSLKAGAAYGSVLINYFVVGAPANEWKISVPAAVGNIDVTGQNVGRDWRREGDTVIVPLSRPIIGAGTLLLTFEQPMSASGGALSPGEIRPLDVQAERGYVQIVSPLQVKFNTASADGPLLAIDPSELPAEFRLLSTAPTLAAWQYTARDFSITTNVDWYEQGETVEQVVDFLKLSTQVSRDGQWVTDARFFVKSKGRAALRAVLPEGTALWEARVNGEPVNARKDGKITLIPLTASDSQASEITLRYGAKSEDPSHPVLIAPTLEAPIVIGEWTVTGDENRTLVPRSGDLRSPQAATGWQYLAKHPAAIAILLLLGSIALAFGSGDTGTNARFVALVCGLVFIALSGLLALNAAKTSTPPPATLEYAAPVVAAGEHVVIEIGNYAPWRARTGWNVALLFLLGTGLTVAGFITGKPFMKPLGLALVGASFLSIRNGAPIFLALLAVIAAIWCLPKIARSIRNMRRPKAPAVTATLLLLFALCSSLPAAEKPAESMIHDWAIKENRLHGTIEITLRADAGDRFLLLRPPATLTGFEGDGLKVSKSPLDKSEAYFITAEATGRFTAKATFEMPLASPAQGFTVPSGPAAMREITLRWDQGGWEFQSPQAARITEPENLAATESGAVLILGPTDPATITARPAQRDISSEKTEFFADVSNLFLPGPGVVNAIHSIAIRPTQGRVSELLMDIPDGFTVSEITEGPAGAWRFDPEKKQLRIPIEPAQESAFGLTVHTQMGTETLPVDLSLTPIRVQGSSGEVGFLALAFGGDAQAESIETTGLSEISSGDLRSPIPKGAIVSQAFRYGKEAASAKLKVTAVAPELRSESWTLVSLGEDRLVVSADLSVNVTRSGVFRIAAEIPAGLEIETATGQSLSHWTESTTDGKRVITFHLNGKTLGQLDFNLTLTGRPPGAQQKWQAPRITVLEASRETGIVTIVPERGLQVRAVERRNVSQIDPRELTDTTKDSIRAAARPGALAYRLLQSDWSLGLAISRLDPWVTASVFHETTLREGQTLTRATIGYRIENAALKSLRVRIPGLTETSASTVRASGEAVADLVPVGGEEGLYEIRFQRGIAGETKVEIEYQKASSGGGSEAIAPIALPEVRQISYFAAVHAGGRLEIDAPTLPRGWQRADWAAVRPQIGQSAGNTPPLLLFRVADAEAPLSVVLKRHELADLRKLRVSEGSLTTLLSPKGGALTALEMKMQVVAKGTLRLKLPEKAELFNVLVNDEGAPLVRDGDEWLFYVFPSPDPAQPASVRFVYSTPTHKGYALEGPVLNAPMENLTWRVLIPEAWQLTGHDGDFDLRDESNYGSFGISEYEMSAASKKQNDSQNAVALLDRANSWLAAGDQEKASQAFSNAVNSGQLDAASGEDARVQLRELKTQQAVLGLNSRRQKVLLENRLDNAQIEQAAQVNPILQGNYNYDQNQFDQFLMGNTADENSALKEIANRIVAQQLAAEPAPAALDLTIPERGKVLTFHRSVQIADETPMLLTLDLRPARQRTAWLAVPLCILLGAMAASRRR
ncbi:hypothetical protein HZ994_09150 [Akkermansiaceae bacterium]|nr:hypothetical protein HZ994_09150 [Akkermansiaceae bacterium]